jgi:hypothetical protein
VTSAIFKEDLEVAYKAIPQLSGQSNPNMQEDLEWLDDGCNHYCDGVEGEAGEMDEGSMMMVATSRKEGDKQRDVIMEKEVEAIVRFTAGDGGKRLSSSS